eukprot:CAMPEP_0206449532 /NCGR_PEP_ID=MMETSP0324_2-20121206/18147_1 /ASSEMBLY_ACC=CAM_ASM_000836 /TAXON_ID=2866 /ORGANISM="Crypthecodinium cohnii, Strain Seligo" /LENGTH=79 /DNA_ID=CAMNT_0053918931 /DNA_START=89 /DNA_END=325 /DNA_ORIENTATION=-
MTLVDRFMVRTLTFLQAKCQSWFSSSCQGKGRERRWGGRGKGTYIPFVHIHPAVRPSVRLRKWLAARNEELVSSMAKIC